MIWKILGRGWLSSEAMDAKPVIHSNVWIFDELANIYKVLSCCMELSDKSCFGDSVLDNTAYCSDIKTLSPRFCAMIGKIGKKAL